MTTNDLNMLEAYKARINRVVDYVESDLSRSFTLEELAFVAAFSKFHFNRVFHSMMGETLFQFISRLRVEKAAVLICSYSKESLTQLAADCGFSDSAHLSKSFKERFDLSPSAFRKKFLASSNPVQELSNWNQTLRNQIPGSYAQKNYPENHLDSRRNNMKGLVKIVDFAAATVAYVRYIGPYKGNGQLFETLWGKLMSWAGPRGLVTPDSKNLIIYHDSPEITQEDKLRLSVCLTVPAETEVAGEIGKMEIAEGKYAFCRFTLGVTDFQQAWDWVYSQWLPSSGWQADDRPSFELYHKSEGQDADMKFDVEICIPIKPL